MSVMASPAAHAAKSDGCAGGGFGISGVLNGINVPTGSLVSIPAPASKLGPRFPILGEYNGFNVVSTTFGVANCTFTSVAGAEDLTSSRRTVAFQSKTPDLRGATLSSCISVTTEDGDLVISRTGTVVSMKIQAKDCSAGRLFQMEQQRTDRTTTRVVHSLGPGVLHCDNPNFRAREYRQRPASEIRFARQHVGCNAWQRACLHQRHRETRRHDRRRSALRSTRSL